MPHPSHLHILNIQADEKYTSKYIFFKQNNNFLLSQIRHDKPLSTTNNSFVSEQATTSEQLRKQSLLPFSPPNVLYSFTFHVSVSGTYLFESGASLPEG